MRTRLFSFALIIMLSAPLAFAQGTDEARTSFAVLGGVNLQNFNGKDSAGDQLVNDMILGYHAGLNIQIPIAPDFYFQPGFLFSTKGAKNTNGSITSTYKISYLELPLNLVYKALLGKGYFMLGFGPYIGYGIMGKTITESGSGTSETAIEFQKTVDNGDPSSVSYFKSFDAGGNIFAGYELSNGIFFQLDTQLGVLKINPEDRRITNDKTAIKNTGYGISIGYRF